MTSVQHFFAAYRQEQCEHLKLSSPEIDKRLKEGPELVSANFVIPYPPGFPIMVPGQVINAQTIEFMRKLDVKEIHGFSAALGLKLLNPAISAVSGCACERIGNKCGEARKAKDCARRVGRLKDDQAVSSQRPVCQRYSKQHQLPIVQGGQLWPLQHYVAAFR